MIAEKNIFICDICKKEFYRRGTRIPKTCSLKCKAKYNAKIQTGKQLKRWGKDIKCKICGKMFYVHPSKVITAKYCSINCRNKDKDFFSRLRGKNHPSWKGGKNKISGYMYIKNYDHPYRNSGNYVAEHRLEMEKKLNRYLNSNEEVHHINGNKIDNRIENLELVIKKMHFGKIICPHCQKQFKVK